MRFSVLFCWLASSDLLIILPSDEFKPNHHTNDKSTLVGVMTWDRRVTGHYLIHSIPSLMSPYGVTRPHWVNWLADIIPYGPWNLMNSRITLWWRHNDHNSVSECLLNRLFRRRSKKTSKLRVTGLCVGNSPGPVNSPHKGPVTRECSIWWRHHGLIAIINIGEWV